MTQRGKSTRSIAPHSVTILRPATWTPDLIDWFFSYGRGCFEDWPELPLAIRGTSFRKDVWRALLATEPGTTVTYGELADRVGRPGAARAVGAACRKNPLPVLVPCHRVIRADGSTGNYSGPEGMKTALLKHERRHTDNS